MTRPFSAFSTVRYLLDACTMMLAFSIAGQIFPDSFRSTSSLYLYLFYAFSIVGWFSAAQVTRLYSDLRSNKYAQEITYIAFTVIVFFVILTSFLFLIRWQFQVTNYFLLTYLLAVFVLTVITKYALRKFLHRQIYQGKLVEKVLLIGSTPAAKDFYDTINKYYYYGYKCIGFIDDENQKLNGCPYLGDLTHLDAVLQNEQIHEVIIALPNSQHEKIRKCIEICDFHAKRVRIIPDLHFYASSNLQMNSIGLLPVINLRSLPQDRWSNRVLKRAFDIVFSITFFLLIGWWLLPLIAIAIKLSSKGPVFFTQERWGLNNEKIICYKFRSMVAESRDTDEQGNYLQASRDDHRITTVGKYLRKTNMDELPQFWNVLLGNMSIVGPRPHPTPLNLKSIQTVDRYMLRHLVKPGITGWAQVNGSRGETRTPESMQQRVNFDLYYIHRWTFWLDCQIIIQTVINIFRGDQNAY